MTPRLAALTIAAALLLPCGPAVRAVAAAGASLSLDEYKGRLATVVVALDDARATPAWPGAWAGDWPVRVGNTEIRVDTGSLQRDFAAWRDRQDTQARARVMARLELLQSEAEAAAQPPTDLAPARARVASILEAPEFHRVHAPSWQDRLRQAAIDFLRRIFRIPIISSSIPTIGRVLVYGLITMAVLVVAWSLYRYILRPAEFETILPAAITPSFREWQAWLADAQAAGASGDWRQAVHLTYWCAVAFLESRRMWRPDPARTPREYVRLLPATGPERASLAELTSDFERVWYGTADADAEMFAATLAHLKKIGCPVA